MKVLFDQNVPRQLVKELESHAVTRAAEAGWDELANGALLQVAEDAGFSLLLTCDQNLEYQQTVTGRKIAIVSLSTNNWPVLRNHLEQIVEAVNEAVAGSYARVDCGKFSKRKR